MVPHMYDIIFSGQRRKSALRVLIIKVNPIM